MFFIEISKITVFLRFTNYLLKQTHHTNNNENYVVCTQLLNRHQLERLGLFVIDIRSGMLD